MAQEAVGAASKSAFHVRAIDGIRAELAKRPASGHAAYLRMCIATWETRAAQILAWPADKPRPPCGGWEASLIVCSLLTMLSAAEQSDRLRLAEAA